MKFQCRSCGLIWEEDPQLADPSGSAYKGQCPRCERKPAFPHPVKEAEYDEETGEMIYEVEVDQRSAPIRMRT